MEEAGLPLERYVEGKIFRGLITGLNEAFIIDDATRREILSQDRSCAKYIRPFAVGKDIRRWTLASSQRWIIYVTPSNSKKIPDTLLRHLLGFKKQLESRANAQEWYELQQPQEKYISTFEAPKIIYQEIATYQSFAYDPTGIYVNGKVFMLPCDDLYLLAILNSAPAWEYLSQICSKMVGGALAMQAVYLSKLRFQMQRSRKEANCRSSLKSVWKAAMSLGVNNGSQKLISWHTDSTELILRAPCK